MIRVEQSHLPVAARTHPGMAGKQNEDRYAVSAYRLSEENATPALLAVLSDGIGGHRAGEVAAEIAVNQISEKAKKLGVTQVEELGIPSTLKPTVTQDPALIFGINERFAILEDFVDMVATKTIPSAVITGQGGLGKSHTVFASLAKAGLKPLMEMDEALF